MLDDVRKEQLKGYLPSYVQMITERSKGKNQYICPLCHSGEGPNRTGAFTLYDGNWRCYSCGKGGDIFDLIEQYEGISSFPDQVRRIEEIAGLPSLPDPTPRKTKKADPEEGKARQRFLKEAKAYIERCNAAASDTDYFAKRKFSEIEVSRFKLGYDQRSRSVVIPYNAEGSYYVTRKIKEKEYKNPETATAGPFQIFYESFLDSKKPCFVCEGAFDAISIMSAGQDACNAIALGGSAGHTRFLNRIRKQRPSCPLILAFDNDDTGQRFTEEISSELKKMAIPYSVASFTLEAYPEDKRKDPNDMLCANRKQLQEDIELCIEWAPSLLDPIAEKTSEALIEFANKHNGHSAKVLLKNFKDGITDEANTSFIPSGYEKLDEGLDGGLYPGLYIIGAVSSLGKTTFMLQMADQIAESGRDVLLISLETDAKELISKSISRLTYQHSYEAKWNAKTARDITTASRYEKYSEAEKQVIRRATDHYERFADNLYIYEGMGDIGVQQIREIVQGHKDTSLSGKAPVVMIDYLQILAPNDPRASDKQNIDKAVLELKRLSRDFKTPVLAVSSFNRDNYENEVNLSAFKESGTIEYGSDVLLALQPQGMKKITVDQGKEYVKAYNRRHTEECKKSDTRKLELVVLKNRNGRTGMKYGFKYYAPFNLIETDYNYKEKEEDE